MTSTAGIPDRELVSEALTSILGNTQRLAGTTLNFRWNVHGPSFLSLHELFLTQANELWHATDEIGEFLRATGAQASADESENIILPCVDYGSGEPACFQMKCILMNAHAEMGTSLEAAIDVASAEQDHATVHLLSARLIAHRGHRRMLAGALAQ